MLALVLASLVKTSLYLLKSICKHCDALREQTRMLMKQNVNNVKEYNFLLAFLKMYSIWLCHLRSQSTMMTRKVAGHKFYNKIA